MRLLYRSHWNYLKRHPWLYLLCVLGVALGVAVVVAMDLASQSARRSFELSTRAVTGRATHTLEGSDGVPEELYVDLRLNRGLRRSAPVVEGYVTVEGLTLRLLGVDPFAEREFRDYVSGGGGLVGEFGGVLLSRDTAARLGVEPGDTLKAEVGERRVELTLAGLLVPANRAAAVGLANLVVADIATAQDLLEKQGRLSRIDLVLEPGQDIELPPGVVLREAGSTARTMADMTSAFHLNLQALSLLALVVGVFLIYNVMTFSVVQRRPLLGRLRAVGVLPGELFTSVMFEAAVLGGAGSLLGLVLGVGLGRRLVELVATTLNDMYYVLEITSFQVEPSLLAKGGLLGLGAALAAAAAPARAAAGVSPAELWRRSSLEHSARSLAVRAALWALGCAVLGLALLWPPLLAANLVGLLLLILAGALVTPWFIVIVVEGLSDRPLPPRMAMLVRGASAHLSRTGVAVAALMVAVSATVSIGIMIGSFRATLTDWLHTTLVADVYLTPAGRASQQALDPELMTRAIALEGVKEIVTQRSVRVPSSTGETQLAAMMMPEVYRASYTFRDTPPADLWERFERGGLLISEPYAERYNLHPGDFLELVTSEGPMAFPVLAVFYNYAPDHGLAVIDRAVYDRHWKDEATSGLGLYLEDPSRTEAFADELRSVAGPGFEVASNQAIREASMEIFERTFLVTGVLRLLAMGVAFVGILTTLAALGLERVRELAVLRALGMTRREVAVMVTGQTGLLGLFSGLLALPLGIVLSLVMVLVINRRAFGWTLFMNIEPTVLLQAVALATGAALLGALYPAWRMSRTKVAEGLRWE